MYKAHLFICTNSSDIASKCGNKGAEKLHKALKEKCAKAFLNEPWAKDVRINKSGCLNQCEKGIAAVLYPQNQWFLNKTEHDTEELFKAVETAAKK